MSRVFLSHSSKNKEYVKRIAEKFGKDIAYYDEYSFEGGMKTFEEILKSLSNSDVFVIFLSKDALESDWVKKELCQAKELLDTDKLKQCYPIIIDPELTYDNPQIPDWMTRGLGAYNLRYIGNPILAYQKIKNFLIQMHYINPNKKYEIYIGHKDITQKFEEQYYLGLDHNCRGIIASGFEGIGREAFIRNCIKVPKTFGEYYEPIVINLDEMDAIEIVISKLYESGFGPYENNIFETIGALTTEKKIEKLTDCLRLAQNSKEFIIFRDSNVLIQNNEVIWWLNKAVESLREELTFGIVANQSIHKNRQTDCYFITNIEELGKADTLALLDKLSQQNGLELDINDIKFFLDILTGHPSQIQYCIDRIKAESLTEVKDKPEELISYSNKSTMQLLEDYLCIFKLDDQKKKRFLSYLSFVATYSNVPISVILEINKLDEEYDEFYHLLVNYCFCRRTGLNNDLLTTSSSIVDYLSRNRIQAPKDIEDYLENEYNSFKDNLFKNNLDEYSFSEITRHLGQLIEKGDYVQDYNDYHYIYPSIIIKSVIKLYHQKSYDKALNICEVCKDKTKVWDPKLRQIFYYYYASLLVKKKDRTVFQVVLTKDPYYPEKTILEEQQIDFLKGFYYKRIGDNEKALSSFLACLSKDNKFFRARVELVETYTTLEQYEPALKLARMNYESKGNNIFNTFQYFKCLIHDNQSDNKAMLQKLLEQAKKNEGLTDYSPQIYISMLTEYYLYVTRDLEKALATMKQNKSLFDNHMHYYTDLFDIYAEMENVQEMEKAYSQLVNAVDNDPSYTSLLLRRNCILSFAKNKDRHLVDQIMMMSNVKPETKTHVKKAVEHYMKRHP